MSEPGPDSPHAESRWLGTGTADRRALIPPLLAVRFLLVMVAAAAIYFFHDFVVPVLAALVIAFASWPRYRDLLRWVGGNTTLAASIALSLIVTVLVVPIVMAIGYAFEELRLWFHWTVETNRSGAPTPEWIVALPGVGEWLDLLWSDYVGHPGAIGEMVHAVSGDNIASIYRALLAAGGSAFDFFLTLVFMLILLFFAYRNGSVFARQIDMVGERLLPARWVRISRVVPATISSTVTGMTLIAIGEGIVLGLAYWILGVPSPVTLGMLTGLMALIPGGAPLCFTLVSIYLAASGSPASGIALFVWGSVELFIVDKTLRPRLVGGRSSCPSCRPSSGWSAA